jgi:hypothetical protein
MGHFIEQCEHGLVGAQCRCPDPNKEIKVVDCCLISRHSEKLRNQNIEKLPVTNLTKEYLRTHVIVPTPPVEPFDSVREITIGGLRGIVMAIDREISHLEAVRDAGLNLLLRMEALGDKP